MRLEIKPHKHGDWQVISHTTEKIDVTCKDDNGEQRFIETTKSKCIFLGPLNKCEQLLKANGQ